MSTLAELRKIFRVSKRLVKAIKEGEPREIVKATNAFEKILDPVLADADDGDEKQKEFARLAALEEKFGIK